MEIGHRGSVGEATGRDGPRSGRPQVVAALGQACALPLDMLKWETMDNKSLLLSSMRLLIAVVQKCQIGMERMEVAEAKGASWAAEREKLQKSLEAKDGILKEEASRNASLAADLDARAELVRLEEELQSSRRVNKQLISQRNEVKGQLEITRKEKAAELESTLAKQKAEFNVVMGEEALKLAADYRAQLLGIRDRA
ncbi:hypothetical protein AAC387_Pa06g0878 [Persea americana]